MAYSPLFWPVQLKGNTILILDETRLPHKLVYLKIKDYKQACAAIKEMKTRAVGQVLLVMYTYLLESRKNKNNLTALAKVAKAINASRPTLSFKTLTDMLLDWSRRGLPIERCILGFLDSLKNARVKQTQEMSGLIKDKETILTYCNVSGLMPLIADFCKKQNKKISFFIAETRPYLQGSRLTAWELKNAGPPVTLICDNMVAQVMSEGKINKVIVGADHLAQNGDIANKIGTYQIALLARHFGIPFYVLCPPASAAKSGRQITIEIRPERELIEFCGRRIAPQGIKCYYPAFDITPANLITKHIHLELEK